MIIYILQSTVLLAISYTIYLLFLKKSKHFVFTRYFLLATLVLSLVSPLVKIDIEPNQAQTSVAPATVVAIEVVDAKPNQATASKKYMRDFLSRKRTV